jgi:hypothetical protein
MGYKKPILIAMGGLIVASLIALSLPTVANANNSVYKIALKRPNPATPISRDGILSAVNDKYDGRIMSVEEKPTPSTPDCHIVRMLSLTGEYMTIRVACD